MKKVLIAAATLALVALVSYAAFHSQSAPTKGDTQWTHGVDGWRGVHVCSDGEILQIAVTDNAQVVRKYDSFGKFQTVQQAKDHAELIMQGECNPPALPATR